MLNFLYPYQESKIKPYLKMAIQRLQIAKNKKTAGSKHAKKEISQLLAKDKEEMARIKAEHIIREDFTIEAYEIIELLCELLHERIRIITMSDSKNPPEDLVETIASLIWASDRLNIPELTEVKNQLIKKFGKKYTDEISNPQSELINARLQRKLSIEPPSASLVMNYLVEIAKEFNIDWEPTDVGVPQNGLAFQSPIGFSIPMAPGTQLSNVYLRASNSNSHDESSTSPSTIISNQAPYQQQRLDSISNTNVNIPPSIPTDVPVAEAVYLPSPPSDAPPLINELPKPPNNDFITQNKKNNNDDDDNNLNDLQARLNALRDL